MSAAWEKLGTHSIRMNEDIVELRQCGTFTHADAIGYFDCVDALIARHGYCLSMFDHRQGVSMEPRARSYIAQRSKALSAPTALAVFGGSLPYRTLSRLIVRAINMVRRPPLLMAFFNTEMEARAYLSVHRSAFQSRPASPSANGSL